MVHIYIRPLSSNVALSAPDVNAGSTPRPPTLLFVAGKPVLWSSCSPPVLTPHGARITQDINLNLTARERPFWSIVFSFYPLILSAKDGGGEAEHRLSGARCAEQACAHVGQSDLRVEAAGQCGV